MKILYFFFLFLPVSFADPRSVLRRFPNAGDRGEREREREGERESERERERERGGERERERERERESCSMRRYIHHNHQDSISLLLLYSQITREGCVQGVHVVQSYLHSVVGLTSPSGPPVLLIYTYIHPLYIHTHTHTHTHTHAHEYQQPTNPPPLAHSAGGISSSDTPMFPTLKLKQAHAVVGDFATTMNCRALLGPPTTASASRRLAPVPRPSPFPSPPARRRRHGRNK